MNDAIDYFADSAKMSDSELDDARAKDRYDSDVVAQAKKERDAEKVAADAADAATKEQARRDAIAKSGMYEDKDGNLHWNNGKLALPRQTPNAQPSNAGPEMPESEKIRARLDAMKPGEVSEATRLTAIAWKNAQDRGQTKLVKPKDDATAADASSAAAGKADDPQRAQRVAAAKQGLDAASKSLADAAERKKTQRANRRIALANATRAVLGALKDGEIKTAQSGKRFKKVALDEDNLGMLNQQWRANGGKSAYRDLYAFQEVGSNGEPIGKPIICTRDNRDGQSGAGKPTYRRWTVDRMETAIRDAYKTSGQKDEDADDLTYQAMGGYGQIGKAAAEKRIREEEDRKQKANLAERAAALAERKAATDEAIAAETSRHNKETEKISAMAAAGKGASKPMSEAERNKQIGAASANLEFLKEQLSALEEGAKDQSVPMAEVAAERARLEAAIKEQQKTLDALSGIPSAAAATFAPTPDADAVKAAKEIKAKMAVGGAKKGAAGSAAAGETPTGEAGAGAEKIGGSSADAGTEPGAGDKTAASHSENDDEDKKLEMAEGKMDASFRNDGGEIAVKDGEKRYVLRGLEYLSDEECKRLGIDRKSNVVDYIDANVAEVQKSAAKAKKAFDKTRSKAIEDIRRKARSLYPNSKAKREKYVSTETNAWEAKNDPSVKAKLRQGLSEQLPTMM